MGEAREFAHKSEPTQTDLKDSYTAMSVAAQQLMQLSGESSSSNNSNTKKVVKREKMDSKINNDRGINQDEEVTSLAKILPPRRLRYHDIYMATKPLNNVKKMRYY